MAELLNNEMRKLDPCPFCGGEAKLCKDVWPTGNGTYAREYWVRCKRCKACSDGYKSADDAAQAWNQRDDARWHSVDEPGQPPVDQALLVCVSGKPRENITLRNAIELATYDPSDPGFWILSEWPDGSKQRSVIGWRCRMRREEAMVPERRYDYTQGVCRHCEVPKTEVRGYGHWLMLNERCEQCGMRVVAEGLTGGSRPAPTGSGEIMTNADRIRSMNDEELAQMLCGDGIGFDCYDCQWDVRKGERCNMQCHDNCLAWLRQEAKEDKP